jgi:hypothetical protein
MANFLRASRQLIGLAAYLAVGISAAMAVEDDQFAYYGQEPVAEDVTETLPFGDPTVAPSNDANADGVDDERQSFQPDLPAGFPKLSDVRDPRYRWPSEQPFSPKAGSFRHSGDSQANQQPFASSMSQGSGMYARPRGEPGACQEYSLFTVPKRFPACREWLAWRPCCESCGCGGPGKSSHMCNGNGCDTPCGGYMALFQPTPGLWYARAEAVALRLDTDTEFIAARTGVNGQRRLGTTDMKYPYAPLGIFTLGRYLDECTAIEATYTGYGHWEGFDAANHTTANTFGGIGVLTSPFTNFGQPLTPGLDGANFVRLDSASHYQSGEVNFLHRLDTCCGPFQGWFLMGGRYLNIREGLTYLSITDRPLPGGHTNTLTTVAHNELYGVQIGFLGQALATPCCWFDFESKAGIFGNASRVTREYTLLDENAVTTVTKLGGKHKGTTLVGDLKLTGNYMLTDRITTRLGYTATFVQGVANGAGNMPLDVTSLTNGPVHVSSGALNIYHGPVTGFTYVW